MQGQFSNKNILFAVELIWFVLVQGWNSFVCYYIALTIFKRHS